MIAASVASTSHPLAASASSICSADQVGAALRPDDELEPAEDEAALLVGAFTMLHSTSKGVMLIMADSSSPMSASGLASYAP